MGVSPLWLWNGYSGCGFFGWRLRGKGPNFFGGITAVWVLSDVDVTAKADCLAEATLSQVEQASCFGLALLLGELRDVDTGHG
jgi:hypothetical protein